LQQFANTYKNLQRMFFFIKLDLVKACCLPLLLYGIGAFDYVILVVEISMCVGMIVPRELLGTNNMNLSVSSSDLDR